MASETPDDSTCPTCSKPIRPDQLVVFEHGDMFHVACRTRATTLRAMELRERTAENLTRATEYVARAKRLMMGHEPPLVCAACATPLVDRGGAIRQGDGYVHFACAAKSDGSGPSPP